MSFGRQPSLNSRKRQTLGVLCLLLVSVLTVAQSAHDHQNDAKAAQHCSVCFAAHQSLVRSAVITGTPTLVAGVAAIVERASVASLLLTENAYIRPPPVA